RGETEEAGRQSGRQLALDAEARDVGVEYDVVHPARDGRRAVMHPGTRGTPRAPPRTPTPRRCAARRGTGADERPYVEPARPRTRRQLADPARVLAQRPSSPPTPSGHTHHRTPAISGPRDTCGGRSQGSWTDGLDGADDQDAAVTPAR